MEQPGAEPTNSQDQATAGSGGESQVPPLERPVFPQQQLPQQGQPQAAKTTKLILPPPGGLNQSPEELTRQVTWTAIREAATTSATTLYPDDPKAAVHTVVTLCSQGLPATSSGQSNASGKFMAFVSILSLDEEARLKWPGQ